jgi:hypothetical protein
LPALFLQADAAATRAQQTHYRLLAATLALLVAVALLSAIHVTNESVQRGLSVAAAVLLALSTVLTLLAGRQKYDAKWFRARTAAESIKSLSWKYMCGAEPFPVGITQKTADSRLASAFAAVTHGLDVPLTGALELAEISPAMQALRLSSLAERKEHYREYRLADQRTWYLSKAASAERQAQVFWYVLSAANFLGFVFAIVRASYPQLSFDLVAVLAAVSTAIIAWIQSRRLEELSQSYSVASKDLNLATAQLQHVESDGDLARFVADCENAISREHTLWAARRESSSIVLSP